MALWYLKILYGIFIFLKISFSVINVLIGSSSIKTMFIIKVQKYRVETHKIQCKINSEIFITNHYWLNFFPQAILSYFWHLTILCLDPTLMTSLWNWLLI